VHHYNASLSVEIGSEQQDFTSDKLVQKEPISLVQQELICRNKSLLPIDNTRLYSSQTYKAVCSAM
jgi:hypothetical protein